MKKPFKGSSGFAGANPPTSRIEEELRKSLDICEAEIRKLNGLLDRCRTVFVNMTMENTGMLNRWRRWAISDEPLRADAANLLPLLDEVLPPRK